MLTAAWRWPARRAAWQRPASASAAEPAPFGHACTAQNGVRFCPTETLAQRVPSFDGVPLDVDVTLPATGTGPFPTIVMLHGWGGEQDRLRVEHPRRRRQRDVRLQQRLLRPARLRGRQLHGPRLGPLVRLRRIAQRNAGLRKRLAAPGRPALRGARHPVPARAARRREASTKPAAIGRHRHLLRRRPEHRARLPEEPHPPARRRIRPVDEPEREKDGDRGGLPALAVVGPGRRAGAQRALPRHRSRPVRAELRTAGRDDPELRVRPVCRRLHHRRLLRAGRHGPRSRPHEMVRRHERRRALRRRSGRDRQTALHLPPGLRDPARNSTRAAAARERLDRPPVPGRAVAARVQPGARA